jgi:hypothetical protein
MVSLGKLMGVSGLVPEYVTSVFQLRSETTREQFRLCAGYEDN